MQQEKIKIDLSGVSETLLIPLWARAKFSEDHSPLLNDSKAIEIVKKIDYDFSTHVKAFQFDILREPLEQSNSMTRSKRTSLITPAHQS